MKKRIIPYSLTKTTLATLAVAAAALIAAAPAHAGTGWVHGGNWASGGGYLTNDGVFYPAGISTNTTPTQAAAAADIVADDLIGVGINFIRYPINPATIEYNWQVTQAAVNELVARGLYVDICCWYGEDSNGGIIPSFSVWKSMWQTVDGVYKNNNMVYYEPINEPWGYTSASSLESSLYTPFLGFINKSQNHIILDGTGYANDVTGIGSWVVANNYGCLLAVHDYAFWHTNYTSESTWESQLQGEVGSYYGRTILTEFGAETDNGLNYGASANDNNISFIRGITAQCSSWGMGSCYFPAEQPGHNKKRLFQGPGAGLFNQSMVNRLQYLWNTQFAGVEDGAANIDSINTPIIIGVDMGGTVYRKYIQSSGYWSSWTSMGSPNSSGAEQWGANIGKDTDGDLEAFVTGASDHAVWRAVRTSSGWSSFSSLGGGGGNLSRPAVISDNDGRLNVFVVGSDNAIWWDKQTVPCGSWSGWTRITGTTAKSGEAPTAILNASGSLEVFYNKQDNTGVCHVWQNTSGGSDWTWNGQTALGTGGGNKSGLTATRNSDGRLEVSVVGSDNKVWHNWQVNPGGSWNGWYRLATNQSPVSGQAPCVAVNQSGALEMFINATNNGVYHIWQSSPGGGWNTWTSMGGGGNNLTRFWGLTQVNGDLEVFVVGSNNAVWTDTQTSPGGNWTGWQTLYGVYDCW